MNRNPIFALLAIAMVMPTQAQDLGTPVITPPILSEPETGGQLLVPPTEARPAPAPQPAPDRPAVSQAAPAPAPAADPTSAPAAEPASRTQSTQAFDDWTLECFEPAFDDGACQVTHRVLSGGSNQVVMVMALSAAAENGPVSIQMALPLGIALAPGVGVVVGNGYQSRIPLDRCTPQGCIVEGTGSAEFLAALKREARGALVVENEQGQQIQLPFSLNGFTAAFDQMLNGHPEADS
jgi:invasion protein IalB